MITRRDFIKYSTSSIATLTVLPVANVLASPSEGYLVNDIHSQLNQTTVYKIATPKTSLELKTLIKESKHNGYQISISGARHAMGTQQFGTDSLLIDIRGMDQVISLDKEAQTVEVQSGTTWPKLIRWLNKNAPELSIIQKQTGADELTIGGALASNIHGRGLTHKPIIGDVDSFTLINYKGEHIICNRQVNAELFSLAIGGYGLFGIIDTVKLRLMKRIKIQRVVEITTVKDVVELVRSRINDGFLYGDFQYLTDERSDDFLRKGVFSCYKPVQDHTSISTQQRQLDLEDWQSLYALAHTDKKRAYETYRDYYMSTNGQVYWSDLHQFSTYLKDQNKVVNKIRGLTNNASLMISELYVPKNKLHEFMESVRKSALEHKMNIIYGTIRFIQKDNESYLPWAKENYACVIFNLEVTHTKEGIEIASHAFRELIDISLALNGNYFLTYHRWARKDQIENGYPQFKQFLELKKKYDPDERFSSDWYQHYKKMFSV